MGCHWKGNEADEGLSRSSRLTWSRRRQRFAAPKRDRLRLYAKPALRRQFQHGISSKPDLHPEKHRFCPGFQNPTLKKRALVCENGGWRRKADGTDFKMPSTPYVYSATA